MIESVVSPQHTCILVNTSQTLGIETYLEQRFPTNVVLSLVSGAEITQLGPSEFEHKGGTGLWVGAANSNPSIPASIQTDMAEALSMTLKSGQVDCEVSTNIRQQQYERMAGCVTPPRYSQIALADIHIGLLRSIPQVLSSKHPRTLSSLKKWASARLLLVSSTSYSRSQKRKVANSSPTSANKPWRR